MPERITVGVMITDITDELLMIIVLNVWMKGS